MKKSFFHSFLALTFTLIGASTALADATQPRRWIPDPMLSPPPLAGPQPGAPANPSEPSRSDVPSPIITKENLETPKEPPLPSTPGVILDQLEASVNDATILRSDVRHFRKVMRLKRQLDPFFAASPLAEKGALATDGEIVDFLVKEKLVALQFPVDDAEVEQNINSIQNNNHITRDGLKQALAEQGFSYEDYKELIRTAASLRNLVDREIRPRVAISDEDVKNYYYNHFSKNSVAPKAFHIQLIGVSSKHYKTPKAAREVISHALALINKGESFEEVAKMASDLSSRNFGGDLGVLSENELYPFIRDAVKNLEIGAVTHIIEAGSPPVYYLVKLVEVKSTLGEEFEKAKEEIRTRLANTEYQRQLLLWEERQRDTSSIHKAGEPTLKSLPATAVPASSTPAT